MVTVLLVVEQLFAAPELVLQLPPHP